MGQVYQCWCRIGLCSEIIFSGSNTTCFTFYINLCSVYWLSLVSCWSVASPPEGSELTTSPPRQGFFSNGLILSSQSHYAVSINQSRHDSWEWSRIRNSTCGDRYNLEFRVLLHRSQDTLWELRMSKDNVHRFASHSDIVPFGSLKLDIRIRGTSHYSPLNEPPFRNDYREQLRPRRTATCFECHNLYCSNPISISMGWSLDDRGSIPGKGKEFFSSRKRQDLFLEPITPHNNWIAGIAAVQFRWLLTCSPSVQQWSSPCPPPPRPVYLFIPRSFVSSIRAFVSVGEGCTSTFALTVYTEYCSRSYESCSAPYLQFV
jgi:hypothetical protein